LSGTGKGRVSSVWGEVARERSDAAAERAMGWLDCELVLWDYVFPRFEGTDWYRYVRDRYCREPRELALSLCCGDGHVERDFLKYGLCEAAEGIDISPEAIEICQREAAAAGMPRLRYRAADVERTRLPERRYDVVVAWMALHHLRRLSHVFREVRRALAPGGIFVANEYVGPARFQMPRRRLAVANELLAMLPEELKRMGLGEEVKERCDPVPLARMMREDPSEGVSSVRILPLLRQGFRVVEQIEYGGTFLMLVLSGIAQNFRPENPEHRAVLHRLYAAEREVIESGEFASDFAFVIAQRPEDSGPE